jgi:RNA polymerase sigma-70 factor (ECF subfamily)
MATVPAQVHAELAEEREWIERVQRGDAEAFRHLYDRYARYVFRYTLLRIHNQQDAEDVTADTFVRAWRSIGKFEWREIPFGAWLIRIAQNLIIDRVRKPFDLSEWLPWQRGREEVEFSRIEDRDEILGAFSKLSNEQQVILYLHFFEGYNLTKVAQFLGKTPNAVTVAQFRALERLRKVLKDVNYDPAG